MNKKTLASIMVILGGVFWGVVSIFVNKLNSYNLEALDIAVLRMFFAAVIFSAFVLIKDKKLFIIKKKDLKFFLLNGLCSGLLFNGLYFYTIIKSEASIAVMLLYTSPIFVFILTRVSFKARITKTKYLCMVVTIIGCVFVSGALGGFKENASTLSIITGILTGAVYGTYTVITRYLATKYNPICVTVYGFIFGLLFMLPFANYRHIFTSISNKPQIIFWAVGIGLVCSVLANATFTWGISYIQSSTASILSASEPFTGAVVGMLFFNESHNFIKIIGILLVFLAIIIQAFEKDEKISKSVS